MAYTTSDTDPLRAPKVHPAAIEEHGRGELATSALMLARHQYRGYGLCDCSRAWPCSVAQQWAAYVDYWAARLDAGGQGNALREPTIVLPVVAR